MVLVGALLTAAWVAGVVLVSVAVPAFHLLLAAGVCCLVIGVGQRRRP